MNIGKLVFTDSAAKKPLSIAASGGLLNALDLVKTPSLRLGSLHTLKKNDQVRLTLARYDTEPENFKLGTIANGLWTKSEILEQVKQQTEFGQLVVNTEMAYCNELIVQLAAKSLPVWPEIPKQRFPVIPDWKPVKKCFWFKVKTRALFCENTTDGVTSPIAAYRIANVHAAFTARGFNVSSLTGSDDDRAHFIPLAKSSLTGYIGGVGHGNATTYTGNAGNHILETGVYDSAEVSNKALHFLSCQTGITLGPDTITKGARSYAGYTANFTFVWDNASTPVNEFELFVKSDSTFDIMMANGATAQAAYNSTIAAFNAAMALVPGSSAASWLMYDRDHLSLFGNPATIVLPYRWIKLCFPLPLATEAALATIGELAEE